MPRKSLYHVHVLGIYLCQWSCLHRMAERPLLSSTAGVGWDLDGDGQCAQGSNSPITDLSEIKKSLVLAQARDALWQCQGSEEACWIRSVGCKKESPECVLDYSGKSSRWMAFSWSPKQSHEVAVQSWPNSTHSRKQFPVHSVELAWGGEVTACNPQEQLGSVGHRVPVLCLYINVTSGLSWNWHGGTGRSSTLQKLWFTLEVT